MTRRTGANPATPRNPTMPLLAALAAVGMSAAEFAAKMGISKTVLSYRMNGDRFAPLAFVRRVERKFPHIKMADWPAVWDRRANVKYRYGAVMASGETPRRESGSHVDLHG